MCDKCNTTLEKYKILYTAYADEIRNLWQRSIFLGAFMTLAWGGYGALQLKILDNTHKISVGYYCASFGICLVIIVLSLLWVAMAKGSKFVQEAHEEHIKKFVRDESLQKMFCDLDDYKNISLNDNLAFSGTLKSYRYSPSKINIALGWISCVIAVILFMIHIFILLLPLIQKQCSVLALFIIAIIYLLLEIIVMAFFMKDYLKGGNKMQCKSNFGGEMARKDS